MEKTAKLYRSYAEAEQANRERMLALTPDQRMQILFEINASLWENYEAPERLERVCRLVKRPFSKKNS